MGGGRGIGSPRAWYARPMPDRSSKPNRPVDINQLAAAIVGAATEGEPEVEDRRDPAAVALGRKGGLKGGKARAEKLTPEERAAIARKAAAARWMRNRNAGEPGYPIEISPASNPKRGAPMQGEDKRSAKTIRPCTPLLK